MTPEALRALLTVGETLDVEFKSEEVGALSDCDLLEAIVCLANRPGTASGWLLVGVEDEGRVSGARARHESRTDCQRVQALIAHRTRPSFSVRAEVVLLDGKGVLAIEKTPARGAANPKLQWDYGRDCA